jgi:hypothetical protein
MPQGEAPLPGSTVVNGFSPEGPVSALPFRSELDLARAAYRPQVPGGDYPIGYLGTTRTRREDRLGYSLARSTSRQYQRGALHGSKIDMTAYLWTERFNPESGLVSQAQGMRFAPPGEGMVQPQVPTRTNQWPFPPGSGLNAPKGSQHLTDMKMPMTAVPPDNRVLQMRSLLPQWT